MLLMLTQSFHQKNPVKYYTFMYIKGSDAFHYVLLDRVIPPRGVVTLKIQSDACDGRSNEINTLEHVQVRLSLSNEMLSTQTMRLARLSFVTFFCIITTTRRVKLPD